MRRLNLLVVGLLFVLVQPAVAQTGTIEGQVTEASGDPLPGVNVVIQGETIGASTDTDGIFVITGVPEGAHVVEARFVGYQTQTREVEVSADETVTVNFQLREERLGLDEIVVTGTGGEVERRSIGHTVAQVDFAGVEDIGAQSLEDALAGKEAGLNITLGSGSIEQQPRIRIRGSSSIAMSNEPLIYIDGVRIDSHGGFAPGVSAGGLGQSSALSQLNLDAIERVEILKGPSAATLYGSQANGGVIQIFTKQGTQEQAPQFSVRLSNNFYQMPDRFKENAGFVRTAEQQQRVRDVLGVEADLYEPFTSPIQLIDMFDIGMGQEISGSARGGGEGATYYSNVRYSFTDGPFNPSSSIFNGGDVGSANDMSRRFFWSGNLSLVPSDQFRINVQGEYTRSEREVYGQGITIYTPTSSARYAKPERVGMASEYETFGIPFFATPREGTYPQVTDAGNRGRIVLQTSYLPVTGITADLQFGVDYNSQRSEDYTPFGYNVDGIGPNPNGALTIGEQSGLTWSLEGKFNWSTDFGEDFRSTAVTGFQSYRTKHESSLSSGTELPGPGLRTVDATSVQSAGSGFEEVVDAGFFVQEQLGYRDALYLTVGVRLDASSAFGEEFNYATYPKASLSFLPMELFDFSMPHVSELRLRSAWGQSGQQPGAFDRFTTFVPVNSPEGSGVRTGNLGNPNLKPETASEWEVGIDLGLFEDQFSLSATYWDRETEDALVARGFAPSGGFSTPQLVNAALLRGKGLEFSLEGDLIQRQNFSLNMFAQAAYLWEQVESLGGAPPIKVDPGYVRDRTFVREGFSPGAYFGTMLPDGVAFPFDLERNGQPSNEAAVEDYFAQPRDPSEFTPFVMVAGSDGAPLPGGQSYKDHYLGKQTPDWDGSFGLRAQLHDFSLSTRFSYAFGNYYHHNLTDAFRRSNAGIGRNIMEAARLEAVLLNPESSTQERIDAAREWVNKMVALTPYDGLNEIERADYLRWQNLSLSYNMPQSLTSLFGVDSASITLRGSNIALWSLYGGVDPTATGEGSTGVASGVEENFKGGFDVYGTPQLRTYTITLRMDF